MVKRAIAGGGGKGGGGEWGLTLLADEGREWGV